MNGVQSSHDLTVDDLVEAWVRKAEFSNGPVHDYWTERFDLMCFEFGIVPPAFDRDQQWLWEHGERIARDTSHRLGAGLYEVPRVVAEHSGKWRPRLHDVENARESLLREMVRDCIVTVAPHAQRGTTSLERLIELGLDPVVPDPFDYF